MKVLILSCNTGEGHNSCAKAIKEALDDCGDECILVDALQFISNSFSRFVSWGHSVVYRKIPGLFKAGYSYCERHPSVFYETSGVYRILTSGSQKLYQYILENQYDVVLCVHVFSALMLTSAIKNNDINIHTGFVATDYTCSPSVRESCLDTYYIPDDSLKEEFEFPNISVDKMVVSGIPIRQMFYECIANNDAKERVGIPKEHDHLLVMCGSMGCGPIKKIIGILAKELDDNCDISVVCGHNRRLKNKLEKVCGNRTNIHIYGFVENMSILMDSADLYITKPGGLSVTEAFVKNLPMVYIDAVAGCEKYNADFFISKGGALSGKNAYDVANICIELIHNKEKLSELKRNLQKIKKINFCK